MAFVDDQKTLKKKEMAGLLRKAHLCFVFPDPHDGWNRMCISCNGHKYSFPRDGCPRYLEGKELKHWFEVVPSSAVPSPIWVKYGDVVVKVEPAKNDVDSLKDAAKAKCGIVQGPFPLLVRNHAEKLLDESAPLTANSKASRTSFSDRRFGSSTGMLCSKSNPQGIPSTPSRRL